MKTWSLGYGKAKIKAKGDLFKKLAEYNVRLLSMRHVSFTSEGFNHLMRKAVYLGQK